MFWVPGAREICLWMGAVDARKKTAKRVLNDKSNLSLFIYPGGSKEIFLTDPKSDNSTPSRSNKQHSTPRHRGHSHSASCCCSALCWLCGRSVLE